MPSTVISVENLSKAYRIGLKDAMHDTLVGALKGVLHAPFKNWRRLSRLDTFRHNGQAQDIFWALKDVSFEVQEGEVLGIIGRNGAGKSTLLKILSRITEPTSGRAVIRGRVSSLLEVGTGFHQELTGRENIYMNGTILGMTRREIDRKMDAIVDFSGVEQFLDTPVKRYSSGMKVRLAFSVAAHLEPEILIVDEVLAVGDMEFQKKCLGKMHDVARGGRTVLFVSHNLGAVQEICTTGMLLADGKINGTGAVRGIVNQYLVELKGSATGILEDRLDRKGKGDVLLRSIELVGEMDNATRFITGRQAILRFFLSRPAKRPNVLCIIHDHLGSPVVAFHSKRRSKVDRTMPQAACIECVIPNLPLLAGHYAVTAAVWVESELQDYVDHAISFDVENGPYCGRVYLHPRKIPGSICIDHQWVFLDSISERSLESSADRLVSKS